MRLLKLLEEEKYKDVRETVGLYVKTKVSQFLTDLLLLSVVNRLSAHHRRQGEFSEV